MFDFNKIRQPRTIAAIVALGISTAILPGAFASPERATQGVTPPGITTLINSVGNDIFSTIDISTLTTALDPPTQHFGPYTTSSDDSGTCGNDWATDTFDRHFTVLFNSDGTVKSIVEQFKDGSYMTPATDSPQPNPSPGGCQTTTAPAGYVSNGVTGNMHGYFVIPAAPGTVEKSSSPYCNGVSNSPCDTATFISAHFSCAYGSTCPVTSFFFHYTSGHTSSPPNSQLIINEWKNASTDRGGNQGDIRSCNNPC